MLDVTAFGELLIDFVPAPGSTPDEPLLKAMVGGAPGNFAAAAQAYGAHSAVIGKVGQDAFGDLILRRLGELGMETRGVVRDGSAFTTLAFVTLSAAGERTFSFAREHGADTRLAAEECDYSLIDEARLFHFGTLSLTHEPIRSATEAALKRARVQGKLVSCDPNLRLPLWHSPEEAKARMLWALEQADIVKISDDEVQFLFGCGPEEGAERILRDCGPQLVFVTQGAQGCCFASGAARGRTANPAVRPVDTTGAGDIFFGAAVSRLLRLGKPLEALTEGDLRGVTAFACAAAALSTQRYGGIASIPPEAEVLRLLAEEGT